MANKCTICRHDNRLDIDWMIVNQVPYRDISLRFNVGVMSVQRHRKHIETEIREIQEVQKIERGTNLMDRVYVNQRRIEEALQRARNAADLRSEAALIKLEQTNMEIEGKMTGAFQADRKNDKDVERERQVRVYSRKLIRMRADGAAVEDCWTYMVDKTRDVLDVDISDLKDEVLERVNQNGGFTQTETVH